MGSVLSKQVTDAYVAFWRDAFHVDASSEFGIVGAGSVVRCGLLCFLTYWIPIALLRRKLRDRFHLRSAAAFGLFGALYRTVRVLVSRFASQTEHQWLHTHSPLLAGCVGAAGAVAVDPSFVSSVFVIWWGVRAARTLPVVHRLLEEPKYGPLAVMAVASGLLCPAGLKAPEEHHVSYRKFLEGFFEVSGSKMSEFQTPKPGLTIGQSVAGKKHLIAWYAAYCAGVAWACVKLYAPLHLVWALLRLPNKTYPRVIAANTARSVAFLTTYVCGLMACLLADSHCFLPNPPRWHVALWAPIPALALLVERQNRQSELAFFCLSHGLNSLYNRARLAGLLCPNNVVGALLLMVSTGRIMGKLVCLGSNSK